MSDAPKEQRPQAKIRRSRGLALVWLVPIAALGILVWLGVRELFVRGPEVTITFESADGLEAGRTKVRHSAVDIGTVESVRLSSDLQHVVATARIDRDLAASVTSTASFWVVRPRLSPGGISGLDTIVSGAYLEMEPGKGGDPQYSFKGLEDPPVLNPPHPGKRYTLHADRLGGLGQGAPIYYRGVVVGQTLGFSLAPKGDVVDVYAFVRSPWDVLVHQETRFWNASGISISAGAQGIRANIESLQALVAGGITFDNAAAVERQPAAPDLTVFKLYDDDSTAHADPYGARVSYRVDFPGSIRGLVDGSSVELKGVNVGQVTEVHLEYDPASGTLSTPAVIEIDPERLTFLNTTVPSGDAATPFMDGVMSKLIQNGLRARLGSANLLTGQKLVALEVDPDAKPGPLTADSGRPQIPTVDAGDLDSLTKSATGVMNKIQAMPLDEIGRSVRNIVDHLDKLTGSEDMKMSVHSLNQALANLSHLTATANTELPPLVKSLRRTSDAATKTLDALGGKDTRGTDLQGLMHELTETARSFRALADFLQEHPEALIKGRTGDAQ